MNPPAAIPLPHTRCPLCGGSNGCAPAACGSFDTPCWCTGVRIPAALIARLPAEQRGTACVCRRCIEGQPAAPVADCSAIPTPRGHSSS
ncbi:cysteine-rich CWC family protein [Aquincola sp. S2]|uniref:Cysteine-rich CWC family protein n=1 Tax=Pseudaquabacterium terrae TaxID=2732868 RepID=A0ABX2EGZ1_9BURK|nr:cysteine-rich CWC family protein [Aquabacterium terrae]NRF67870.1 cysteine-rich CWC family protein [Aquabacterium terrae]